MMRRRMIKELRERETHIVQARPIQVAKHDPLFRFFLRGLHQALLRAKIVPDLAVIDDSINPCPKLWIHRLTEFLLPPQVER